MATRWLTPTEAARRLRVSESTIWRFLRREQLPSVNALFALAGSFRSDGKGPGSADKHRYFGAKR